MHTHLILVREYRYHTDKAAFFYLFLDVFNCVEVWDQEVFSFQGVTCDELDKDMCSSGACIDRDKICDYSNDCFDLSDETASLCSTYKHRCTFEDGSCAHWTQDIDSTASWVVHKASPDTVGSLPALDHTTATVDGLCNT